MGLNVKKTVGDIKGAIKDIKRKTRWVKEDIAKNRVDIRETQSLIGKMSKKPTSYNRGWKNPYQRKGKQPKSKIVKIRRKKR